jgi:hypothetical protein
VKDKSLLFNADKEKCINGGKVEILRKRGKTYFIKIILQGWVIFLDWD